MAGNVVEGNSRVTENNWKGGVQFEDNELLPAKHQLTEKELRSGKGDLTREQRESLAEKTRAQILNEVRADEPYPHAYLTIQSAEEAYEFVLQEAGATLPKRDPVDERVVEMVRTGKVGYTEGKGIITDIEQVGGYPEYKGEAYPDADSDGMPDDWEREHNLNPDDASDAVGDMNGDGYTHIEDFLYGLDPGTLYAPWTAPRTYQDLFWR